MRTAARWKQTPRAGVGHLDGGGDVGNVVGEEGLGGGAALAVAGAVGGALKVGLPGEDAERGHEDGAERAGGFSVVCVSARLSPLLSCVCSTF